MTAAHNGATLAAASSHLLFPVDKHLQSSMRNRHRLVEAWAAACSRSQRRRRRASVGPAVSCKGRGSNSARQSHMAAWQVAMVD